MRTEPDAALRRGVQAAGAKGVAASRQQGGGHESRHPVMSVLRLTCRMRRT